LQLENYATTGGKGASGLNFFNVPSVTDAAARALLTRARDSLRRELASERAAEAGQAAESEGDRSSHPV